MKIELNDDTKEILGMLCFQAGPIAHLMNDAGIAVEKKAETEQAVVIHWLLNLYIEHGSEWRKKAAEQLGQWQEAAKSINVHSQPGSES